MNGNSHSPWSPSAAHRWGACPGSVAAIESLPVQEEVSSPYAERGTWIHDLAAAAISTGFDPSYLLSEMVRPASLAESEIPECCEVAAAYAEYARAVLAGADVFGVESRVEVLPEVWGTADLWALHEGVLRVIDLKTGHVLVGPEDNPQLILYALGVLEILERHDSIDTIELGIWQHGELNTVKLSRAELEALREVWLAKHAATLPADAPRIPGEKQCQYCPFRAHCPELKAQVLGQAQQDFAPGDLGALAEAYKGLDLIRTYVKGVEEATRQALDLGLPVPGLKLVEGRRTRKWVREDALLEYLSRRVRKFASVCYKKVLLSPAQLEKLVADERNLLRPVNLEQYIEWGQGSPTIALEDDKRQAFSKAERAAADFAADVVQ